MGAGHHDVGAELERVTRQVRVKPEVGGPCRVDDQWYTVLVRHLGQPGDITDRTDVGRVADEHRAHLGVFVERTAYGVWRNTKWQSGREVDFGAHPNRGEAGQHQA